MSLASINLFVVPFSPLEYFDSAPTSGGKTLVAELLLLRALLKHNGTMALLVVPYVALALEKRDYFRDVWGPLQVCSPPPVVRVRLFCWAQTIWAVLQRALEGSGRLMQQRSLHTVQHRPFQEARRERCSSYAHSVSFLKRTGFLRPFVQNIYIRCPKPDRFVIRCCLILSLQKYQHSS